MNEEDPRATDRGGLVFSAIEFAAHAHAGQYRKGTRLPYIIHPLSVARLLIEQGLADPVVAAGILHDTVEDTEATLDDIHVRFGSEVAGLVEAVSEPDKDASWEERKQTTVRAVRTASLDAVFVEVADKLDNIRSIAADQVREGERVWERFNSPKERQRWYYQGLLEAFAERLGSGPGSNMLDWFEKEVQRVFG